MFTCTYPDAHAPGDRDIHKVRCAGDDGRSLATIRTVRRLKVVPGGLQLRRGHRDSGQRVERGDNRGVIVGSELGDDPAALGAKIGRRAGLPDRHQREGDDAARRVELDGDIQLTTLERCLHGVSERPGRGTGGLERLSLALERTVGGSHFAPDRLHPQGVDGRRQGGSEAGAGGLGLPVGPLRDELAGTRRTLAWRAGQRHRPWAGDRPVRLAGHDDGGDHDHHNDGDQRGQPSPRRRGW